MREALEGNIRNEEDHLLDWLLIGLLLKLIFVLDFSERTQKRIMVDENLRLISRVMEKSIDAKRLDIQYLSFRVISFFSRYPAFQNYIVTLPVVKTMFASLKEANGLDKKFILSILLDIMSNLSSHKIIKSLSWSQGMELLINTCFNAEPMAVGKIF